MMWYGKEKGVRRVVQIKRLYNILALAIQKIEQKMKPDDFKNLKNIHPSYGQKILRSLQIKMPELFAEDGSLNSGRASEWKLKKTTLVERVEECISFEEDTEKLVYLIRQLDLFLEKSINGFIPVGEDSYRFESLNDNVKESGIFYCQGLSAGGNIKAEIP